MLKENVLVLSQPFSIISVIIKRVTVACPPSPPSQLIYHQKWHDIVYRVIDLPLLLQATKWLFVWASCVAYIDSCRT